MQRWRIGDVSVSKLVHSVQVAHPSWGSRADTDKAQAEATRHAFLQRYADRPVLILGTHFAGPTGGHLVRDGDAYRLDC
jgi:hypothetical protein